MDGPTSRLLEHDCANTSAGPGGSTERTGLTAGNSSQEQAAPTGHHLVLLVDEGGSQRHANRALLASETCSVGGRIWFGVLKH